VPRAAPGNFFAYLKRHYRLNVSQRLDATLSAHSRE
jgi:hypothetical protein